MPLYLDVLGVECAYGALQGYRRHDLFHWAGMFCGHYRANGSGKSTLLRCISRTLKPVRGTVLPRVSLYK